MMTFRFAIVGAGLTGTSMLCQFVRRLACRAESGVVDPPKVHIRVFDKQSVTGPGFPHNERIVQPYHITNMCAEEMGVLYARQEDFSDWVESRRLDLETRFPAFRAFLRDPAYRQNSCSHYPRALMGEYLKARFTDALKIAESLGIRVEVHTEVEVTDIAETEQGSRLYARSRVSGSLLRFKTDQVLLATGHWPRNASGDGYFSTPWPAHRLLAQIPSGTEVAVIGSSLSAIETALTLTSDGGFVRAKSGDLAFVPPSKPRRITLLSRHGLLPRVRCLAAERYLPRFFNSENLRELLAKHSGSLRLDAIFHLLDRELEWATGKPFDWTDVVSPKASPIDLLQSGLKQACKEEKPSTAALSQSILRQALPLARELYLALSISERMRFDRDYSTLFFAHAATQPPANAEKILALMRLGIVRLVKLGRNYRFSEKSPGPGYEFVYGEQESLRADFRYVIDARGQQRSVHTDTSELTRNLIRRGLIHLGEIHSSQYRAKYQTAVPAPTSREPKEFATESVWIEPGTHRVMQVKHARTVKKSSFLYAVGAMTRGQIIDVSMARGLTRSTDRIAEHLADSLV